MSITIILLLFLINHMEAKPTYISHVCSNTTHNTYMLNVELLLSSFSSYANSSSGFYNASAGQDPDVVYGLFLCRGDLSPEICQDCVSFATQYIIHRCPTQKMGITWYDECFIRYSNEYIFSTVAVKPFAYQMIIPRTTFRLHNASQSQLVAAISVTAANAAFSPSGSKINFATGEFEAGPSEKLHNILQCTPDILSSDCYKCLLKGIGELPNLKIVKQGGIFLSSCIIRFNLIPVNPSPQDPRAPAQPPSLPLPTDNKTGRADVAREKAAWIIVGSSLSTILGILFFSFCVYTLWKRKSEKNAVNIEQIIIEDDGQTTILVNNFHQMPLYTLQIATQFFSEENKLGQGGFGPVYKGTLEDGREIAIKRRSMTSRQGLDEFMNEVKLIANLQHRNLVRLLGYCLEQNEKLLVYEYMPNKSLDAFLFDSNKSFELNWQRRLHIMNGIGRGLLYLHEDSRLKIIHMDMKTSNILLDRDLNPKISDFGMSRIFDENQSEANTKKIAGTYGYMAPEYAIRGLFSIKSDVFSFGVILLEIISGKKNNRFHSSEVDENLLTFAWKLWSKNQELELMDPLILESSVAFEVSKCIHIGLLCVQEDPADRPTMSSVVIMLSSDNITLPQPKQPAVSVRRLLSRLASSNQKVSSNNQVSLSDISPR